MKTNNELLLGTWIHDSGDVKSIQQFGNVKLHFTADGYLIYTILGKEKEHNKPRLPLFVLTAHEVDEVKEKCEEAGIDYIFNKPFTNKDVQIIKLFMENKE